MDQARERHAAVMVRHGGMTLEQGRQHYDDNIDLWRQQAQAAKRPYQTWFDECKKWDYLTARMQRWDRFCAWWRGLWSK